jgi:uncharacterized protein (DUF488 family)
MLFTLGTSNRTFDEFLEAAMRRGIRTVVDVRSRPWSRLPHFRKAALENALTARGMRYEWRGDLLGGMNDIATDDPAFLGALDQLLSINGPIAICCSEGDPAQCHRSAKVGAAILVHRGISAINILRDGSEEPLTRTLLRTKADNIPCCMRDAALSISIRVAVT